MLKTIMICRVGQPHLGSGKMNGMAVRISAPQYPTKKKLVFRVRRMNRYGARMTLRDNTGYEKTLNH